MSKVFIFTLSVVVSLMFLDFFANGEEMSTSPTPLPLTEPTPLPTPVSMQNLRALQTTESDMSETPQDMVLAAAPEMDDSVPVEVPLAPVRRAPLKPDYANEQGESKQFKAEDSEGRYAFGFVEDHSSGGSFRKEIGDETGRVQGYYGLRDVDGRIRIVSYIADKDGFRADIQTNEPGFEVLDPASTTINKGKPVAVANPYTYDQISGKNEFD